MKKSKKTITMIETLVTLLVISIMIVGPITFASKSFFYSRFLKHRTEALMLAQEGIELATAYRNINSTNFNNQAALCSTGCSIEWNGTNDTPTLTACNSSSPSQECVLKNSLGQATDYYRKLIFTKNNSSDSYNLISKVWTDGVGGDIAIDLELEKEIFIFSTPTIAPTPTPTNASTVSFSLPPGTYVNDQTVTISGTNTTSIRYTTDGSDPICGSGVGTTNPSVNLIVTTTQTIKAVGCNASGSSSIEGGLYIIDYAVNSMNPSFLFSPNPGTYNVDASNPYLEISFYLDYGTSYVRYTTNGSNPTCSSGTLYYSPFHLYESKTIKAIGCNSQYSSAVETGVYTLNPATMDNPPRIQISHPPDTYNSIVSLTIEKLNADSIRWTTDGSDPTCNYGNESDVSVSFSVNITQTIKAIGCNSTGQSSIEGGLYIIDYYAVNSTNPYPSISFEPEEALHSGSNLTVYITGHNSDYIYYTLDEQTTPTCAGDGTWARGGEKIVAYVSVGYISQKIKAIACSDGGNLRSAVEERTYTTVQGN